MVKELMVKRVASVLSLLLAVGSSACATSSGGATAVSGPTLGSGEVKPPTPVAPEKPPEAKAPSSSPDGAAELTKAAKLAAVGDATESRRVLQVLARSYPDSAEGYQARHQLARSALKRGHFGRAEALTRRTLRPEVAPALAFVGWSLRGKALEGLGRFDDAAEAYGRAAVASGDEPTKKAEATEGRARATFLGGDPSAAAEVLVDGKAAPDKTAASDMLRQLVKPRLTSSEALERLYGRVPSSSPWSAWVALQLAREKLQRGAIREAGEVAGQAFERGDPNLKQEAAEVIRVVAAWNTVKPKSVGVMLPLSGPYQGLGQAALEAIQLALGRGSGITLVVRDTKGDATIAAKVARELILDKSVASLLGPIGEKETAAAVAVSGPFGVPHLALSRHHAIGANWSTVFRMRLSRVELGQSLAQYAFKTLKVKKVAILYPNNASGFRHMASFWDEMVRLGGEVRAVDTYEPGTTAFNPVVQRLVGAKKRASARVDFEGLFIPDRAMAVRRIVPFLKYWGVRLRTTPGTVGTKKRPAVQLLGSDGWNHSTLVDPGEHLTDNAVFVAPFFHDASDARADAFAIAFKQRYSKAPLAFHAEVFDATSFLARSVVKATTPTHAGRSEVLTGLRTTTDFAGATGPIVVIGDNSLVRAPHVLTVDLDTLRKRGTLEEELKWRAARRKIDPTAK